MTDLPDKPAEPVATDLDTVRWVLRLLGHDRSRIETEKTATPRRPVLRREEPAGDVVVTVFEAPGPDAAPRIRAWRPRGILRRLRLRFAPVRQLDLDWERILIWRERRERNWRHAPYPPVDRETPPPPPSARRTVLVGMHFLEIGGAEAFAIECILAAAQSYDVIVVTDTPSAHPLRSRLGGHPGIRVVHLDRHVPEGLDLAFLARLIASEDVFALHINHCDALYDALPALRYLFPGLKVIDTTHIVEPRDGGYARLSGVWTNFIDRHHVISDALRAYLAGGFGAADRIALGYLARGAPPPERPNLLARGDRPLTVAFIGRMEQQKRPLLFVLAAADLRRRLRPLGIAARFIMMGDGSRRAFVRETAARLGLADALSFLPPDSSADSLLRQSDILLVTSEIEGLTLVAFEAIAAGALVISADVGAQGELVPPALLLPPRPSDFLGGLAPLVARLLRDEAFAAECWAQTLARRSDIAAQPAGREVVMQFLAGAADAGERRPG